MKAMYAGICWHCGHTWPTGADIVPHNGAYIHAGCAPGADDE